MELAIEVKNLTHYYGTKMVYENLNFKVEAGSILGLLGKNGTGKSTTINLLNGFLMQRSGEALIYGENTQQLKPQTKARVGFLIEGHIQYSFMNIKQIETFYRKCYQRWKPEPYWELMKKLKVSEKQKISSMSCGQRSQVALGIILAQDPDLLILDDFSMGLDPGYRRLFIDYLRDYAKSENKTIFTTSHIIQDMERLIDDVLIIDHNEILAQQPIQQFLDSFKQYTFKLHDTAFSFPGNVEFIRNIDQRGSRVEVYSRAPQWELEAYMNGQGIVYSELESVEMCLEDAFIGLTGKY